MLLFLKVAPNIFLVRVNLRLHLDLLMASGNSFHGLIYEFPGIGVDKFNLNMEFYLLTHHHADHLVGLKNQSFLNRFYCTKATKILLMLDPGFKHILPYCVPLEFKTYQIPYNDGHVKLSLVDSYHCPGSTMFLIEGQGKAVLVTGDVRAEDWWLQETLKRNPILLPYISGVKKLDNIYLDSTFAYRGEPFIEIPSNSLGISMMAQLLKEFPKDDEDIQFYFMDHTSGFEEGWASIINSFNASVQIQDDLNKRISKLKSFDLNSTLLFDLQKNEGLPRFNISKNFEGCKLPIRINQCIAFNILDWIGALFPVNLASLTDEEHRSLEEVAETSKGHKAYEFRSRIWLLPYGGKELLPTSIKFLFSRHSSYSETRNLVSLFKPIQVYPCSGVSRTTWKNGFSMKRIFGDLCSGEFQYDKEMLKMYGEPLVGPRTVIKINRWEFLDCQNELELANRLEDDIQNNSSFIPIKDFEFKGIGYSKFHSDYVKRCMDMKLQTIIAGRGEESYIQRISEYQRMYSEMRTEMAANFHQKKVFLGYNDESDFEESSFDNASEDSRSSENTELAGRNTKLGQDTPIDVTVCESTLGGDAWGSTKVEKAIHLYHSAPNIATAKVETSVSFSKKGKRPYEDTIDTKSPKIKTHSVKPTLKRSHSDFKIRIRSSFDSQELSFQGLFSEVSKSCLNIDANHINQISTTLQDDPSVWFSFKLGSVN